MKTPLVFICGALRSGSSLTHLMLDNHAEISNPGEFDFLFDKVTDRGGYPDIIAYHDWLSTHRIFNSKPLSIVPTSEYSKLIYSFIEQLSQSDSVLALNIHRNFDRIRFLFPEAKFIHLIRDPRDVASSSIGMGWAGNVYYGVDHWIETEESWVRLRDKLSAEQYLQIKFEDLILSPAEILEQVCTFIGLIYSDTMLTYTKNSTYTKPDISLVEQWKTKLSQREIQYVEMKAKGLMKNLDYDLSANPITSIGLIEKCSLKIEDKLFKLRFTIKRYGFYLFFIERLSRVLQLKSMLKKAKVAMNNIDQSYLK